MTYTVILNCYRRPMYLKEQFEAVKNQTIKPSEIWIWHNQFEDLKFDYPKDLNVLVHSSRNFKFSGRWALALLAKTDYVAMFDDDSIPGNKYMENVFNCMKTKPGLYVGVGVNSFPKKRRFGWVNANPDIKRVDFGGHAWVIKTDLIHWFWREPMFMWNNGEDIHLSYILQKYANVNTYVSPHPENDKKLWSSLKGSKYGGDKNAHCIVDKQHYKDRNKIISYYVSKGWKVFPKY